MRPCHPHRGTGSVFTFIYNVDNLLKLIMDVLTGVEYVEDDQLVDLKYHKRCSYKG